ncbi:acylphosphatase [Neptunicella sp. SCSIO 80796]|uniref:acylphosphatase n=1 Tax=Neptunicella plasticusilytica TaxID=3117012 RepID=UPI003A4E0371
MNHSCIKAFVSGRVQGVFYRASAKQQAKALGLNGYAKNLSDGRVEVWLEGAPQAITQMQQWLKIGPSAAIVEQVIYQPCEALNLSGFEVQ